MAVGTTKTAIATTICPVSYPFAGGGATGVPTCQIAKPIHKTGAIDAMIISIFMFCLC
jgi:hypothetical protein